ncbi:MAG: DUF1579 domain-containing protein [Ignavibacteriales bacterium]|nr:DUF1579 domain-containing protein [Ignavibacteriales bacterium]
MKIKTLFSVMMLSVIFFSTSANFAQQGDQAEMMKKWQEYMTPGPVHQQFAKMVGNWKAAVSTYMDGQETKSEATATYQMVLGGRYLHGSFKGNMMGMPFEGMELDAYDNATKEYISVWVDNMGTGVMYMKGKLDEKTGDVVYMGTMVEPISGKDQMEKTVMKRIDDDHQQMLMFMIDGEKEIKTMQIDYVRVK